MRSSNPVLTRPVFTAPSPVVQTGRRMSVEGVVYKTVLLLALLVVSAAVMWSFTLGDDGVPRGSLLVMVIAAGLVGLLLVLVTMFRPAIAPFTSPLYALVEGVFVGGLSAYYAFLYDGIVPQAVGLTFAVMR